MNDLESRLAEAMRDAVAGIEVPPGMVARARLRARRGWRRPALVVVATGLAAAVAVGVTLVVNGLPEQTAVVPAQVPAFQAVKPNTMVPPESSTLDPAQRSFRVDLVDSRVDDAGSIITTYNGLYDPVRASGEGIQNVETSRRAIRLIGSSFYKAPYRAGEPWLSGQGGFYDALLLDGSRVWGSWNGETASAAQLLAHLRDAGTVKTEKPTGKGRARVDHYSYTYSAALGVRQSAYPTSGELSVWHATGLVSVLSQQTVVGDRKGATKNDPDPGTYSRTLKFWAYDVPVVVEAPPPANTQPE